MTMPEQREPALKGWGAHLKPRPVKKKRATRCSICLHTSVDAIDRDLVMGASVRALADKYGLTKDSFQYHKRHITEEDRRRIMAQEVQDRNVRDVQADTDSLPRL